MDFALTMMDLDALGDFYKRIFQKWLDRTEDKKAYTADDIEELLCFNAWSDGAIISVLPSFIYLTYETENWTKKIDNAQEILTNFFEEYLSTGENFKDYLEKTIKEKEIDIPNIDKEKDIIPQFEEFWRNKDETFYI